MSTTSSKKTDPTWDQRGVFLDKLTISLYVSDDNQWKKRIEQMSFPFSQPSKYEWDVTFFALPEHVTHSSQYLSVEIHPHTVEKQKTDNIHIVIKQRTVPSMEPPEKIKESSRQVGGLPEAWNKLVKNWPNATTGFADITVSYVVNRKEWSSKIPTSFSRKTKTPEGTEISLLTRALSWEINPVQDGISKIIVLPSPSYLYISIDYREEGFVMDADVLRSLDEKLWLLVSRLFMSKVKKRTAKISPDQNKTRE